MNDRHLVIEAVERTDISGLDDAENDLKTHFPNNLMITTHLHVLNLIQPSVQRQDVEAQLLALGEKPKVEPSSSRAGQAFYWREKKQVD